MDRIDWPHLVLGCLSRGDSTLQSLSAPYGTAAATVLEAALRQLEARGHVCQRGETWSITEAGRARYIIDDNCKGW